MNFFDGLDGKVIMMKDGHIAHAYDYDGVKDRLFHIMIPKKIKLIEGYNCSKCRSIRKYINEYGLENFFEFKMYDEELDFLKSHNINTVPVLIVSEYCYTTDISTIINFLKWIKNST